MSQPPHQPELTQHLESWVGRAGDLIELERLAALWAVQAGELIRAQRAERVEVAATKSSATDVVTAADQASERALHHWISAERPGDGMLGEEGLAVPSSTGLTWVVDPIDGTVNYLYDIPAYAVSVAAVVGDPGIEGGWLPVVGAVCNPVAGVVYRARAGGGARRDTYHAPFSVEQTIVLDHIDPPSLPHALLATGFSYSAETRAEQAHVLTEVLPRVRDIRRFGSAALDLCRVAEGSVDGYFERGLKPWDLAAGRLIAHETGARVSGLTVTSPPGEGMVIAAREPLHTVLCELVEKATGRATS